MRLYNPSPSLWVSTSTELLKAGRAANIFAREAANTARLHIVPGDGLTPGHISIAARSDETGDNVGEIDATIEGDEIEVAFRAGNVDLLQNGLPNETLRRVRRCTRFTSDSQHRSHISVLWHTTSSEENDGGGAVAGYVRP